MSSHPTCNHIIGFILVFSISMVVPSFLTVGNLNPFSILNLLTYLIHLCTNQSSLSWLPTFGLTHPWTRKITIFTSISFNIPQSFSPRIDILPLYLGIETPRGMFPASARSLMSHSSPAYTLHGDDLLFCFGS